MVIASGLRWAALDDPRPASTAIATAVWIQTVDRYVDGHVSPDQVAASVRTIGALDPTWVEPWFFGVLMLPSDGPPGLENGLLVDAVRLHPEVSWFTDRLAHKQAR